MNNSLLAALAISLGLSTQTLAQTTVQSQQGTLSRTDPKAPTTSSTTGMQRKGSGKMATGVTRNGNSNLSPTAPTNTQGSTSEGSASRASSGGAPGTNTKETRPPRAKNAGGATNKTAAGAGDTAAKGKMPLVGTAGDTRPARSKQGAKEGSATTAGLTGDRPKDAQDGAQNPPKLSPTDTKNSSRNRQNNQASSVSTSGKTGSRRPASAAQVKSESKKADEMSATGYPSPTGEGKPGTPAGNAKGKKGNTDAKSYPQPTKQ